MPGSCSSASLADSDDALFDSQVAINLKGAFNGLREASRRLRNGGRIISLSSSVVGLYQPTYGVYAATKAGIEAMTHVLAKEVRGRNITVNAMVPGPTATELFLDGKPKEVIDHLTKLAPLERLGGPEDIAEAVSFLAGPDGSWINGQVLRANGGIIDLVSGTITSLNANHRRYRRRHSMRKDRSDHRRVERLRPSDGRGGRQERPRRLRLVAADPTRNASVVDQMAAFSRESQVDLRASRGTRKRRARRICYPE